MVAELVVLGNVFFLLALAICVTGVEPAFLGKNSCSSSSCHGGGGQNQNQSIVWTQRDPHSRAPATLTTARSKRLGELLKIAEPAKDARCTACHAPWQNLAAADLPAGTNPIAESVSCETCHGPAGEYLRSHTRPDLTRGQKLADGLRDLTSLYHRANSCVACHQVVDPRLLAAGHPELLFELDGQTAGMPRHWRESATNTHAATWLTGQATALRELTAQLMRRRDDSVMAQWQSALWIVQTALAPSEFDSLNIDRLSELHRAAEQLSQNANRLAAQPEQLLRKLTRASLGDRPRDEQARRAERLVQAVERLSYALAPRPRNFKETTEALFALVQSRPDFSAQKFEEALRKFERSAEH